MGRKKTHEEFCKEVYNLVGDEYEVIGKYVNTRTKIKMKHNKCLNYINPTPDDFLNGKRCKFCQHRSFKKTTEEFQNEIDEISYNRYKVIEEYKNCKTEIKIKDTISKEIINFKPNSFLENIKRNNGIYKSLTYTTETFKKELNKINSNIYVLGEYIKSNIPILCRCIIDNHEWSPIPSSLLNDSGCPKCANVYKRTHEEFVEEIRSINKNIIVINTFTTIKNNILVKCLKCTGEWEPSAESLLSGYRCPYCSNQKILIGFNDMWTTNPELAKLLANPEDGYKYFQGSNKKVDWKCASCNSLLRNKSIANVKNHGLSCNNCSDGISYPNKLMYNILNQLNVDFIPEYCPEWIKSKRYDFYFKLNNKEYIIEMDGGMGHGNYNLLSKMTPEESLAIDKYKEDLAIQHNTKVIRIDCVKSELGYIKNNILSSDLNTIFDLNKINWLECHKLSLNSLVKIACELWNTLEYSVKDIGILLKLNSSTIVRYLKKGTQIYWCKYNSNDEKIKNVKNNAILNSKKIRCIETDIVYNSMNEASKYINRSPKTISACCRGKNKTCGMSDDGTKLHWEYV